VIVPIDLLVHRKSVSVYSEIFARLIGLQDVLTQINISVFLAWLPGHSGIQYNDLVDSPAKNTALGVKSERVLATNTKT